MCTIGRDFSPEVQFNKGISKIQVKELKLATAAEAKG